MLIKPYPPLEGPSLEDEIIGDIVLRSFLEIGATHGDTKTINKSIYK